MYYVTPNEIELLPPLNNRISANLIVMQLEYWFVIDYWFHVQWSARRKN
jgi:hypothetical protein